MKKFTREERISDAFLILGTQYAASARFSATSFPSLMPICGNLYHHAIEMFLKGYLAKFTSSLELKKIGHSLLKLWDVTKDKSKDKDLSVFDLAISNLDRFEEIRYPDSIVDNGMMVGVSDGFGPALIDQFPDEKPRYKLKIQEMDSLIKKNFDLVSVSPSVYFDSLPNEFRRFIPPDFFSTQE